MNKRKKATWDFGEGQFTYWGQGDEQMPSQYGRVTYLEWCRREASRIAGPAVLRGAYVKRNGSVNRVALFLGKPAANDAKVLFIGGRA